MKLEKMNAFFTARLDGYDKHMMTEIEGAEEFYPYTAALLPVKQDANVLDLGCGTGLELQYYFARNGEASVVGVDLSADMLAALKRKFPDRKLKLICGSYFDVPFEANRFDAAVSVESLHHFTAKAEAVSKAAHRPDRRRIFRFDRLFCGVGGSGAILFF